MQEHPVPQNVTGYEFHLIGQMTLKQFMEVAGGVLVAVLINTTNLPQFIKYPLMIISGLLGAGLAFVPLEGRPLDRWFFAFIKSIYQPTLFFWKKTDTTPSVFLYTPSSTLDTTPQIDYSPLRQSRVDEYIRTVEPTTTKTTPDPESQKANDLLKLFDQVPVRQPTQNHTTTTFSPPHPQGLVSGMGHILEMQVIPSSTQPTIVSPTPPSNPLPDSGGSVRVLDHTTVVGYSEKAGVTSAHQAPPTPQLSPATSSSTLAPISPRTQNSSTGSIRKAAPLRDFPFPNKPSLPNMLAGMVVDASGKIIDNAIITISRQSDNTPVRAIKTNTLGQFSIVTALESDTYLLTIEKDGFNFDKYSLVLNNQVVEPIILQANS